MTATDHSTYTYDDKIASDKDNPHTEITKSDSGLEVDEFHRYNDGQRIALDERVSISIHNPSVPVSSTDDISSDFSATRPSLLVQIQNDEVPQTAQMLQSGPGTNSALSSAHNNTDVTSAEAVQHHRPIHHESNAEAKSLTSSNLGTNYNTAATSAESASSQAATRIETEANEIELRRHYHPNYIIERTRLKDSGRTLDPRDNLKSEESEKTHKLIIDVKGAASPIIVSPQPRPVTGRAFSTPAGTKTYDTDNLPDYRNSSARSRPGFKSDTSRNRVPLHANGSAVASVPVSIPLPPLSFPTYLQLELSSQRPSQIYIHRPADADFPYESSRVKVERLLNFLLLPHHLEGVLWFGTLACLDSWLYTFTILPLRLLKSFYILIQSWTHNILSEASFICSFVYNGAQRMWRRRRSRGNSSKRESTSRSISEAVQSATRPGKSKARILRHHRRTKSVPSTLLPDDKADILKGLLIICTCLLLLKLDASRMYHWVRGQAAIKLYVIYNVLEVCDRMLSAIGQDVLECLFSQESLERKPDGHSKILRPFWLFMLALCYTSVHSIALFYQVVTLNVAVNSYSNALITLLISNQFVEIKSTVFKKFEKENLFQLTCADIVERFQLWHMLLIIAARNIVETGGLSLGLNALSTSSNMLNSSAINGSMPSAPFVPTLTFSSILPLIVSSITAYVPIISHILGPFIIVLGSEMLIDWLKHAYINKFNNTRPIIYSRFLDILAKDYYTNAFSDQNLTKRLGLPVIPLSCLMIRASVQTYHMFIAAWTPLPSPSATSLASIREQYSASRNAQPVSTAATVVWSVDGFLYHVPSTIAKSTLTPHFTTILLTLLLFLILLVCKLILGMALLVFARSRYRATKERERNPSHFIEGGRRFGGWGVVEVDDDKRRRIHEDDAAGMKLLREREAKETTRREQEKERGANMEGLDKVKRYEMVAKRIW